MDEQYSLFANMVHRFKTIAVQHISHFRNNALVKEAPNQPVKFQIHSPLKSKIIPIGFMDQDESTIKGVIRILNDLERATPVFDGRKTPILVAGDELTCMRVESAKSLRSHCVGTTNFNNIYITHGDWHRRLALMRNFVNTFTFQLGSRHSIGSFANIREVMGFKSASEDVNSTFNAVYDLAEVTMHGLATLLLVEIMGIESMSDIPAECPKLEDEHGCSLYLHKICVKAAWTLNFDNNTGSDICENCQNAEMDLVACRNYLCGKKFHFECHPESVKENTNGLKGPNCSLQCSDRIYNYSRALLHACMSQVDRHDTIRVNDAELMRLQMKQDSVNFFNNRNHHYVRLMVNYLLTVDGYAPPQVSFDAKWNRCVNSAGESMRNIEQDLFCEHMVKDTKKQINVMQGATKTKALQRRTKIHDCRLQTMFDTGAPSYTRGVDKKNLLKTTED